MKRVNKIISNIGIDLDEVLSESIDKVLEDNNGKIGDLIIGREDIHNYYVHKIDGTNLNLHSAIDLFRETFRNDIDLCISPVLGAIEKLSLLKEKGFTISIITARNEEFEEYTERWIEKHFPNLISNIYHCTDNKDVTIAKSIVCKHYKIDFMVEDNFDYALDIAKSGIHCFLLEKPWNIGIEETHKNIIKVKSWEDIKI